MEKLTIRELRLVISDKCPYSCRYCNLYHKRMYDLGKITKKDLLKKYKIGNESLGLLCDEEGEKLSILDYKFLFSVLKKSFGIEDITLTGGDPFMNPKINKIASLAKKIGVRTTAITKGAPLFFCTNKKDIFQALNFIDRIIFSIDTIDREAYIYNTLPFTDPTKAKSFFSNTVRVLKLAVSAGIVVEVNSVIFPIPKFKEKKKKYFENLEKIIDFCYLNNVNRLKLIEIDSVKTLGNPFAEKIFGIMIEEGFLKRYKIENKNIINKKESNILRNFLLSKNNKRKLEVSIYRTHCPTTFLNISMGEKGKKCEFNQGGELHMDFRGRSFLCQKNKTLKYENLINDIKKRETESFKKHIYKIDKMIRNQKCPFNKK